MKITIRDIKNLPYFFPSKNIHLTRYSYWRDYDYIDSLPKTRKKPKAVCSVPICIEQFKLEKKLPTFRKAYMKSFYLPAVKKGWVKFNQALYDYLGKA
tara:strand:+ start:46 stop:339 length:294 start_codon:yes stop_codon:yes gene_type:complete